MIGFEQLKYFDEQRNSLHWYSVLLVSFRFAFSAKASDNTTGKSYDETIFVISNFSGVDANLNETRSIKELLDQNIGGFRFYLEWEKQQNQLVIKKADGTSISLRQTMHEIKNYLENKPDKILTLFLDFSTNINELTDIFQELGINQYLYTYDVKEGWAPVKTMIEENKRLVVFSMQEHRNSPDCFIMSGIMPLNLIFRFGKLRFLKENFLKATLKIAC